jgi:hypothetical protein
MTRSSAVVHTERRFCIRSNERQIELMDAVAFINGEDRHQLVQRLLRNEVLHALNTDMTSVMPTASMMQHVDEAFLS